MSIDAIEFARANNIHLLCLPSHTTHILQPFDVGVFKSFKSNFSKSCSNYLAKHPGRVVTPEILSSLVADAWMPSLTTLNIMSGFQKCGLFPLNPGAVDDRCMAPSKAFVKNRESAAITVPNTDTCTNSVPSSPVFTKEQEELFIKRFEECFDIADPSYVAWLKINHPEVALSVAGTSTTTCTSSQPTSASSVDKQPAGDTSKANSASDILSEVLVLPAPRELKQKQKGGLTTKGCILTDMIDDLKEKEKKQIEEKEMKLARKLEKEENRRIRAEQKEQKQKERQKAKEKLREKEAKLIEKEKKQREKVAKWEAKLREKEEKRRQKEAKL